MERNGKELTINFIGRTTGSIGISYPIEVKIFYPEGVSEPPVTNEDIKEYFDAKEKSEICSRVFSKLHMEIVERSDWFGPFLSASVKEV